MLRFVIFSRDFRYARNRNVLISSKLLNKKQIVNFYHKVPQHCDWPPQASRRSRQEQDVRTATCASIYWLEEARRVPETFDGFSSRKYKI